jgi:pyruvate formate lyase activating enzyme
MTGLVSNIQRYSVNDGPGIRTTIFFKGCPLSCAWCHNPESVLPQRELMLRPDRCIGCGQCLFACQHGAVRWEEGRAVTDRLKCVGCGCCVEGCYAEARAIVGTEVSVDEAMSEIVKDAVFYRQSGGGVTFSGGEPFSQPEFLLGMLEACKAEDIHTAVDTSGHAAPELFGRAAGLVDLYLYDIKTLDDVRHRDFTGVSNSLILENLKRLAGHRTRVVVRVPVIPAVNDDLAGMQRIGEFVGGLGGIDEIHLLPYHSSGIDKYRRLGRTCGMVAVQPGAEKLAQIAVELKKHVGRVVIGG